MPAPFHPGGRSRRDWMYVDNAGRPAGRQGAAIAVDSGVDEHDRDARFMWVARDRSGNVIVPGINFAPPCGGLRVAMQGSKFGIAALIIASMVLAGCGGGGHAASSITTAPAESTTAAAGTSITTTPEVSTTSATPTSTTTTPGVSATGADRGTCATQSHDAGSFTECVSDIEYFSYSPAGSSGPGYFVRFVLALTNKTGVTGVPPWGVFRVVDDANRLIDDVSGPGYTGQRPPSCYDLHGSQVRQPSGQTIRLPEPICYPLSSATDRIKVVVDTADNAIIRLS